METRACVLHAKEDVRIETRDVPAVGPNQVLVRVGAGGLCGSDIHYFWEGGIGTIRVSEPIIMGHEFAGTVQAVGNGVTKVRAGQLVAINPSQPCGHCQYCLDGLPQQCMDMHFLGSASLKPHTHGGFRDLIVVDAVQCEPVGDLVSVGEAACTEPLAVGVHAVRRAGSLFGKRVLVTGAGPIGSLLVGAVRHAGATEIVVTDISPAPLKAALAMGATRVIDTRAEPDRLAADYSAGKGHFDVAFECTGVGPVLKSIFPVIRPQGTIVQVGVTPAPEIAGNALVAKEIALIGTHRFHAEFAQAARLISDRSVDVRPVISATLPMEQIREAFDLARDRSTQMKVQLSFA